MAQKSGDNDASAPVVPIAAVAPDASVARVQDLRLRVASAIARVVVNAPVPESVLALPSMAVAAPKVLAHARPTAFE
ncbi:hypothetical protein BGZ94_001337 [Podila epigama]|nr:hypothetical protein BGZ94_001337 [Podila epigama]